MNPTFILASNSPRRRELLTMLGMDFTVMVSECDETVGEGVMPDFAVRELALRKATAVLERIGDLPDSTYIIAADTVVCDGTRILGKPRDADDAFKTFLSLSEHEHSVFTGIAVIGILEGKIKSCTEAVETKVVFGKISEDDARFYVSTGEPFDKAGSYGIQGIGGYFVNELHGDYYNVVGLPIARLRKLLESEFRLNPRDYIGTR